MAPTKRKTKKQASDDLQANLDLPNPEGNNVIANLEESREVTLEDGSSATTLTEQTTIHNLDGDYQQAALKNGVTLMHLPFFPAKTYTEPRYHTFEYAKETITLELDPNPKYGGPNISDADLIKFCISALRNDVTNDRVPPDAQVTKIHGLKFTARSFFKFTKREAVGGTQVSYVRSALNRLKSVNVNFYRTPKDPAIASKIQRVAKHSSFILDWTEVSLTGDQREDKNCNENVVFTVKFPEWMTPFFFNNEMILTLNRTGFFFLEPAEKKWYECLHSLLGHQPYVKIRLKLLAPRVDFQPDEDGVFRGRNLHFIREELYRLIATDDLIGISLATETIKPGAEEMVYIFHSNWKSCISQVADPTKPSAKLTKLEAAIYQKEGLAGLNIFRGKKSGNSPGLLKTEDIRKLFKQKGNKKWLDKFEKDQEILKRGDALENHEPGIKPLTGKERKRYERLKLCQRLASLHTKPRTKKDVDFCEEDDGIIDIIED